MRISDKEIESFGINPKVEVRLYDWEGYGVDVDGEAVAKHTKYRGTEDFFVRTVGGSYIFDPYGLMTTKKEFDAERNFDYKWTRCTRACFDLYLEYLQSKTHYTTQIREAERRIHQ